jgi:hypothetical protein
MREAKKTFAMAQVLIMQQCGSIGQQDAIQKLQEIQDGSSDQTVIPQRIEEYAEAAPNSASTSLNEDIGYDLD